MGHARTQGLKAQGLARRPDRHWARSARAEDEIYDRSAGTAGFRADVRIGALARQRLRLEELDERRLRVL
jgi:hypothetical protein